MHAKSPRALQRIEGNVNIKSIEKFVGRMYYARKKEEDKLDKEN